MSAPRSLRPDTALTEGDARERTRTLVSDGRKVAGWTVVSRITGFVRLAAVAAVLGPTHFGNLFQISTMLPNTILAMIGGSLIGSLLVPALLRWRDQGDAQAVRRIAGGFMGALVLVLTLLVALIIAAGPLVLSVMSAAVDDPDVRRQQALVGWPLLAMVMPQIVFYGIAATAGAVQNAHGRFALAAAAPIAENIGIIAVMAASAFVFGFSTGDANVTLPQLLLLGLGTTAATATHAAVQWWGALRAGVPLFPRAGWRDPDVLHTLRLALTSSGYSALNGATYLVLLITAAGTPGGAVAFQVGLSFLFLPVAIGAVPLAAAQLPHLSRSHLAGDPSSFATVYRQSLAIAMFVAIPCALLSISMPDLMASAVAFGGMAKETGLGLLSVSIAALAVGTIGEAGMVVTTSASYARGDARAPFHAMIVRTGVVALGVLVCLGLADGVNVLWTLGLSFSAASLLAAACLRRWLNPLLPSPPRLSWRWLLPTVATSLAAVGTGLILANTLSASAGGSSRGYGLAHLIAILAGSGTVYLALQWIFGSIELRLLVSGLDARASSARLLRSWRMRS